MNTIVCQNDINLYVKANSHRWSNTTIYQTRSVLERYSGVLNGDPRAFAEALGTLSAYTAKQRWIVVSGFWSFYGVKNPYREYYNQISRQFKHVYVRKTVKATYEDVLAMIKALKDERLKAAAMDIITSGVRFCELYAENNQGMIRGKGGRTRVDLRTGSARVHAQYKYITLYRKLKESLGVTPHELRKLALTRLANKGATAADLCEVAGWSSIDTAYYYLQPKNTQKLKEMLR
jgi:integrase